MDYKRTAFSLKEYEYDPATCMRKRYLKEDPTKAVIFARIVPQTLMAEGLACYKEDICTDMMGKKYHGKRCCRKRDKTYKAYEKDMFNIMSIEKDNAYLQINPPEHYRGNIARVFLYMHQVYKLALSEDIRMKYEKWDKQDAVDKKECNIYKIIFKIQHKANPWLQKACTKY